MGRFISLIILVIDVLVIFDIVNSSQSTQKKVLWTIAVVFLPILGPILWYLVGRKS